MPWADLKIAERVAAGADLLDKRIPGWRTRINLETLDLNESCRCILGQSWELSDFDKLVERSGYTAAKMSLDMDNYKAAWFGFNMLTLFSPGGFLLDTCHRDKVAFEQEIADLKAAWTAEIQRGTDVHA